MPWIRTQDKSTLLTPGAIWVGQDALNKQAVLEAETNPETQWRLGYFVRREDAIIELGLIENWIADGANGVYQISQDV